jgi:predicted transcriptional regulator
MTINELVIAELRSNGPMTVVQITSAVGRGYMSVQSAVRDLKRSGYIKALPPFAKTGIYDLTDKPNRCIRIEKRAPRPETSVEVAIRIQPKSVFEWRAIA